MTTSDQRWFHRRGELARDGWESVVDQSTPGWEHTGIRVAELGETDSLALSPAGVERIVVPLAGSFSVERSEDGVVTTTRLTGRASVFSGPTDVLYLSATSVVTGRIGFQIHQLRERVAAAPQISGKVRCCCA